MKIVIAGAGEMGSHLAKMLSGNGHDITIIDADQKLLSDVGSLADVISVEGDSTTFAVLRKAQVRKCDLFIAVNHVENDNVVAAMLAKKLGAKKAIARIDNNEYLGHPRPPSISPACARRTPTWRSSNRAVRISSACWPRGGSTIMSARRILTSGTRRPGS